MPKARVLALLCLGPFACAVLSACGPDAGATQGDGVASPPPASGSAHLLFDREGVPGPWWRNGATLEMFEEELSGCLARGREARVGADDPADAAYRGFLSCMERHSWVRGLPPSIPR